MSSLTKIIVAGANVNARQELTRTLKLIRSIELAAVFYSGETLINKYRKIQPDIIFLDVVMDDMDGFETARFIKEQDMSTKIVMYSSKFDREFLLAVLSLKLDGYLPGHGNKAVLEETVDVVLNNKSYFHYGVGHSALKNLTAYQYLQLLPPVNKNYSINDN
jgi:DNA-binding NarL/FixJ family response regulator